MNAMKVLDEKNGLARKHWDEAQLKVFFVEIKITAKYTIY